MATAVSHKPVDPAQEAAAYQTSIFERLGVPCRVALSSDQGKHVVATSDIPIDTELFNECPIVSWPAQGYVALGIPFCAYCLRQRGHEGAEEENKELLWTTCDGCGSFFCSTQCQDFGRYSHNILCKILGELRRDEEDGNNNDDNEHQRPITKESLARCIAWIAARIATTITNQKLSDHVLEQEHQSGRADSVSRQLFHLASAPFNRLLDVPKGSEFRNVDTAAWFSDIARLLREPCEKSIAEAAASQPRPITETPAWTREIVDALLRKDTMETLLGELSLNSQALNGFVLSEADKGNAPQVTCVLKGGGVYTLQSALNHSCQPNVAVSSADGTHDISLRTTRPIKCGEELAITYIPLENTNVVERRARLKSYFFTCHCARCEKEERVEEENPETN